MADYWKYEIEIPEAIAKDVKTVQDDNIIQIQDTLWVLTLNNETFSYIKENAKDLNGIHIIPFMTEKGALDNFAEHIEEIIDWIIYDDSDKKFIENFMVLPPDHLYAECVPICDKQVYITAKDVSWPEAKLTCFNQRIEELEMVCSFDEHNHAQILCKREVEYLIQETLASSMNRSEIISVEGGMEYRGDFYIEEQNLPKYGVELPKEEGEGSEPKPLTYYQVIAKKTFTMTFDSRFGTMIGSVATGVHTGNHELKVVYLARPDQMDDY